MGKDSANLRGRGGGEELGASYLWCTLVPPHIGSLAHLAYLADPRLAGDPISKYTHTALSVYGGGPGLSCGVPFWVAHASVSRQGVS